MTGEGLTLTIRGLSSRDVWDHENGFYWFSEPSRINKLLAQYDLYRQILPLPGHVFELGVYKAASLIRLATFRSLHENDFSRKIVAFDAYGTFPMARVESPDDKAFVERFEQSGGAGLRVEEVKAIMASKNFRNIELVPGDVCDTLPRYLQDHRESRIAFLHLDMDVKEPTAFALDQLYERVVAGGLIVIDDYNAVAGATEAIDEFVLRNRLTMQKTVFNNVPAFIRKPV